MSIQDTQLWKNIFDFVDSRFTELLRKHSFIKMAIIDPNYVSGAAKLIFDGEVDVDGNPVVSGKGYRFLTSYSPTANDRVLVLTLGGINVILGKDGIESTGGGSGTYVHPSTHPASIITVADTAGNFTSNPKTAENVLNELFTNVDDGKSGIYNAIIDKGVTPTSTNFTDLVSAIGGISGGSTGKKWASGTKSSDNNIRLVVTNLDFTPKYIIAWSNVSDVYTDWAFFCKDLGAGDLSFNAKTVDTFDFWDVIISAGQFSIRVRNYLQLYNWIAFE